VSSRGRRFQADRKKTANNAAASLTAQWKSTSELTTPMSRLDNLLKANSMQHLQTSGSSRPAAELTSASSKSSAVPLSKASQSTGCLLTSAAEQHQQQQPAAAAATAMTRCYLEKPPRAARRAVTIQLDRRPPPAASLADVPGRQSTSQVSTRIGDRLYGRASTFTPGSKYSQLLLTLDSRLPLELTPRSLDTYRYFGRGVFWFIYNFHVFLLVGLFIGFVLSWLQRARAHVKSLSYREPLW